VSPVFAHVEAPVLHLGPVEWFFVGLATVVILAILGPRIRREFKSRDE
jgi:hypothetical protein